MKFKIMTALILLASLGAASAYKLQEIKMLEMEFNLGENIVDVAKKSGSPRYSVDNVAGLISYELNGIPADLAIRIAKNGYQITVTNVFSLLMYADSERQNNLAVQALMLQFSTDHVKSHDDARAFVTRLLKLFRNSQWERYIAAGCPSISGRSSYLNNAGQPGVFESCPLDPNFSIPLDDWIKLMDQTQTFQWIGGGTLAVLSVRYSEDTRGITYSIDLDFEDCNIKQQVDSLNLQRELAEGDSRGWKGTENYNKGIDEGKVKIKILESNALRRGDQIVPRK